MPELPDLTVYLEALEPRARGRRLEGIRLRSPFFLRTADPPIEEAAGRRLVALRRIGKRLVLALEGERYLVLHLMVAGRLRWLEAGAALPGRGALAAFDFESGTLAVTEAGTKRRASLHFVAGEEELAALDAGGIEPLSCELPAFEAALTRENHTLKRALTDPRLFAGIGNAYSDEILHRARLSPVALTQRLEFAEIERLHDATRDVLAHWVRVLREEAGDEFPKEVTAFRPAMAVHGRFRKPCPECGAPVQRIVRGEHETNYCARCQTGGKLLADRVLSRLLRDDWPPMIG